MISKEFLPQDIDQDKNIKQQNLKEDLWQSVDSQRIPKHIAIIMDGNGRWALQHGLQRSAGHEAGALVIENLLDISLELGIEAISLYSFSKENWQRPQAEISFLWKLLIKFFYKKMPKIQSYNIRIAHSGDLVDLPRSVRHVIKRTIAMTKNNNGLVLNFCINYGGRQEIVHAVKSYLMTRMAAKDCLTLDDVESFDETAIEANLYTNHLPAIDLVIRTSGELRISNFLLWQIAYSEIWLTEKMWPDFTETDLLQAIIDFQKRNRRFGGIAAQGTLC